MNLLVQSLVQAPKIGATWAMLKAAYETYSGVYLQAQKAYTLYKVVTDVRAKMAAPGPLTTRERIHLCAEGAFLVLQSCDFVILATSSANNAYNLSLFENPSDVNNMAFRLSLATGAADVLQTTTAKIQNGAAIRWADIAEISLVITFRYNDVKSAAKTYKQVRDVESRINEIKQHRLKSSGNDCNSERVVFYKKGDLGKTSQKVVKWMKQGQTRYSQSAATQSFPAIQYLSPKFPPNNPVELDLYHRQQVVEALNWKAGPRIPELMRQDPRLAPFLCKMDGEIVRHAVKPRGAGAGILYERTNIEERLKTNPNDPPPGWPVGLTFSRDNVIEDTNNQKGIDATLGEIAKELQEENMLSSLQEYRAFRNEIATRIKEELDKKNDIIQERYIDCIENLYRKWDRGEQTPFNELFSQYNEMYAEHSDGPSLGTFCLGKYLRYLRFCENELTFDDLYLIAALPKN